ncbi:MAG TPA: ribosome biogenesis GTPase Der [Gammaproteobacteria bacterium]|nr:ribosome biogenesis GTPase Der [Gammaproteobacteria bacterium]
MIPAVAIVGQPNVGKSTLFNRLTKSRAAIVADYPGVTRDRHYGHADLAGRHVMLIDTGGLTNDEAGLASPVAIQVKQAIAESELILFVVDARLSLTPAEQYIANYLRTVNKPVIVVVNKVDGLDPNSAMADFYALGFTTVLPAAASQGSGIGALTESINAHLPEIAQENVEPDLGIKIAIVGRPNVGKSTLVNRMLGEERVIAFDEPGTTRDSLFIPFERMGVPYTLIDTAGVRRQGRIGKDLEKISVIKTLQAIDAAQVCLLLIDGQENLTDQDLHLLAYILEAGRSIVIAVNKWDGLDDYSREQIKITMDRKLKFVDYAKIFFISAKHGSNVGNLFPAIEEAYRSATCELQTNRLTSILEKAIAMHPPPLVQGRRIKLRFAHAGGHNPPTIVIHGNQVDHVPTSYQRYLINTYRNILQLVGTPIKLVFKSGENPFAGRRNLLTPRQMRKRERAQRIFKDKK